MEAGAKHRIYIRSETRKPIRVFGKRIIKRAVRAALGTEKIGFPCEVNVLLTDNGGIRALNRKFRKMDMATDVLSFPAGEFTAEDFECGSVWKNPESGRVLLGDIVLSLERAAAQGREFGHSVKREISYLTVHSVLHLLGYDHTGGDDEKHRMRAREKEIMALLMGRER